jgi:hypothetical protein
MATYQILYWQHVPLSVKATDEQGSVRQPLSGQFETALKTGTDNYKEVMHSAAFKWGQIQEREGSAAEVAAAVAAELTERWNEAEALALFRQGKLVGG